MGRRRRHHEEHTNHEAWAIPYGDLLTLLLAFFVVMYAISSVNEGKYRVLSDSLVSAFRGTPRTMEPVQVGDRQVGAGLDVHANALQVGTPAGRPSAQLQPVALKPPVAPPVSAAASPPAGGADQAVTPRAAAASAALGHVADQVEHAMDDLVRQKLVLIRRSDFWIEVEFRTDILFPSGSAQLSGGASEVIERLAAALAPFPNSIRVEGHTDNVPIRTVSFFSNWELSAARAASVVRVLAGHGVAPGRLAVIGFGEQRPVQGNDTAAGRNANRRVVVVILSTEIARRSDPAGMEDPAQDKDAGAAAAPAANAPVETSPVPAPPAQAAPASGTAAAGRPATPVTGANLQGGAGQGSGTDRAP